MAAAAQLGSGQPVTSNALASSTVWGARTIAGHHMRTMWSGFRDWDLIKIANFARTTAFEAHHTSDWGQDLWVNCLMKTSQLNTLFLTSAQKRHNIVQILCCFLQTAILWQRPLLVSYRLSLLEPMWAQQVHLSKFLCLIACICWLGWLVYCSQPCCCCKALGECTRIWCWSHLLFVA